MQCFASVIERVESLKVLFFSRCVCVLFRMRMREERMSFKNESKTKENSIGKIKKKKRIFWCVCFTVFVFCLFHVYRNTKLSVKLQIYLEIGLCFIPYMSVCMLVHCLAGFVSPSVWAFGYECCDVFRCLLY